MGERSVGAPVQVGSPESAEAVAVALRSGKILLAGPGGEKLRELTLDTSAAGPPVALKTRGQGYDIIAADVLGSVYRFDFKGNREWKYTLLDHVGNGHSYLVLADVDGDGTEEILFGTERGNLYVLDSQGHLRLQVHASRVRISAPAVADLYHDGRKEIFFGSDSGDVYCVTGKGELLWKKQIGNGRFGRSLPLVADANNDGRYELYLMANAADGGPGLFALDAESGTLLWKAKSTLQTYDSPALAAIDGNGRNAIVFGDKNTRLYAVSSSGQPLWNTQLDGNGIFFAPAVADLNGDGHAVIFETVRGTGINGKAFYALNSSGTIIDEVPLDGGTPNFSERGGIASPILLRFRGEQYLKLIVATAGGQLVCYRVPQKEGAGRILWPGPRNDVAFSGFIPSTKRTNRSAPVSTPLASPPRNVLALQGRNEVELSHGPSGADVLFRVQDPDGAIHLSFFDETDSRMGEFWARRSGQYQCTILWTQPASGKVLREQRLIYTLDAARTADARSLKAFEQSVAAVRPRLGKYSDLADYFVTMTRGFREEGRAQEAYRLALLRHIAEIHPTQPLLLEQIKNPWPDLNAAQFFLDTSRKINSLSISLLGNGHASAAVALVNLSPRTIVVRCKSGDFESERKRPVPAHDVMQIRDVPLILRNSTERAAEDVLPLLGEGQTLRLDPGEIRKVWFTFSSRHLDAGTYQSKLQIGNLLSPEAPLEVSIHLEVYPVRLPEKHVYRQNTWVILSTIHDDSLLDRTIADASAHGVNVFIVPQVTIAVSKEGKLGAADTALHDRLIRHLRGKAAMLLISQSVGLKWPAGFQPDSKLQKAAYAKAIRWYAKYMQSLGFNFSDWAFYLKDEPGLMGDDAAFRRWVDEVREVKAADPDVQIYADPAGGATAEMLQRVADFVDIWQPNLELYRGDPEHLGVIFRHKQFWHYEPPAEQRDLDPLGYYRMKPWLAFRFGMTGGGYWVYSWSDYWFFDRTMAPEFGTVYPTGAGPVTTKRWEASREGIEDFELLWMLKEKAAKANDAEGRKALQLIDEAVQFVTGGPSRKAPDYTKWMDYRDRLIQAEIQLNREAEN